MRRYLVVANRTLGGEHLLAKVKECVESGPCRFHLLVPATVPDDHLTATEGQARAAAQRRLDAAIAAFRGAGVEVDGEVGDAHPVDAVGDVLRHHEFDEIIVSTFPAGPSRWLRQDLVRRMARAVPIPVTHVVADRAPAGV